VSPARARHAAAASACAEKRCAGLVKAHSVAAKKIKAHAIDRPRDVSLRLPLPLRSTTSAFPPLHFNKKENISIPLTLSQNPRLPPLATASTAPKRRRDEEGAGMVVRIRLARFGCRNRPFYRLMAADSRSRRDGKHLEVLGYYDPLPGTVSNPNPAIKLL